MNGEIPVSGLEERLTTAKPRNAIPDTIPAVTFSVGVMDTYFAAKECPGKEPECMIESAKGSPYEIRVASSGFGDDRKLRIETMNLEYNNGIFTEMEQ